MIYDTQIKFNTKSTMSKLCDYAEAYILVKGTITVAAEGDAARAFRTAFKNCAPFTSCITEINNTQVDNAQCLDITMPMYNLLQYSKNYVETVGELYQFKKDTGGAIANNDASFEGRSVWATNAAGSVDVEISVPLKYLSNFWRSLEMPLINTEVNLILTWSQTCVLSPTPAAQTTTFTITNTR